MVIFVNSPVNEQGLGMRYVTGQRRVVHNPRVIFKKMTKSFKRMTMEIYIDLKQISVHNFEILCSHNIFYNDLCSNVQTNFFNIISFFMSMNVLAITLLQKYFL